MPVVDGRSIPEQTWDPHAPEISAKIPIIVGTCKDEAVLGSIGNRDPSTFSLDEAGMRERVTKLANLPAADVDQLNRDLSAGAPIRNAERHLLRHCQ